MRALVVVESVFGNTRRIAEAVTDGLAEGLGDAGRVRLADVGDPLEALDALDLLVVGGPTHAFGMTRMSTRRSAAEQAGGAQSAQIGLREWLADLPAALEGARAASFDTRMDRPRLPGSAAAGAARKLRRLGYQLVARPTTFRVTGTQGPLRDGETDRARGWGVAVARAATSRPVSEMRSDLSERTSSMSTLQDRQRIVVGVDGSPRALEAVRWAAAEAARRGVGLRLVAAGDWHGAPTIYLPLDDLRATAMKGVDAAAVVVSEVAPAVPVEKRVELGNPVVVLADESRHAGLVVVGADGFGRIASLVAGSVAVGVTTHAACPVVVVRGDPPDPAAPVLLGVDASPVGETAIAFAFETAAARKVGVIAVHTWGDPPGDVRSAPQWSDFAAQARRELSERLAGWREKYPDVALQPIVSHSQPARALIDRSAEAQLVVVGSRGHGELVGLLLDSVSNTMVHRSACPVAVMRPPRS